MYHDLPRDARFWQFLFSVDEELARTTKSQGCSCGGRLHGANYPRKPRGAGELPEVYDTRLSFCCDRDGCRKRSTPPSVRFLGRKVYLGAVVILVAAMRQGPSPRRVRELTELFGADRRTIARWQVFWREHFPQTPFWKVARGRFVRLVLADLPRALLEAFAQQAADAREQWQQLLKFLSPITSPGALLIKGVS
jgi:hypothetical protein